MLAVSPNFIMPDLEAETNLISQAIHDQGKNWSCWAYAIATSLRGTLHKLIRRFSKKNLIDKKLRDELISKGKFFQK